MRSAVLWLVLLVACEEKVNTGALSEAGAASACDRVCTYRDECGFILDYDGCVDSCAADVVGWASSDAFGAYTGCISRLECEEFEEDCAESVGLLEVQQRWLSECRMSLASCEGYDETACEFGGLLGDFSVVAFVAPAIMNQLLACLGEVDCTARAECIAPIAEEYGFGL